MANMAIKTNFSLVFLVVSDVVMVMFPVSVKADDELMKENNMTFYLHDYSSGGPNSTDLIVVGFPGKRWSFFDFGSLAVFDDLLTEGPEPTSAIVGRGQGIGITISLDGVRSYSSFSLVFTNEAYNGSTVQILDNFNQFDPIGEYSLVSGTGKFRYAKGYAILELTSYDNTTAYALFRVNVSARLY